MYGSCMWTQFCNSKNIMLDSVLIYSDLKFTTRLGTDRPIRMLT